MAVLISTNDLYIHSALVKICKYPDMQVEVMRYYYGLSLYVTPYDLIVSDESGNKKYNFVYDYDHFKSDNDDKLYSFMANEILYLIKYEQDFVSYNYTRIKYQLDGVWYEYTKEQCINTLKNKHRMTNDDFPFDKLLGTKNMKITLIQRKCH